MKMARPFENKTEEMKDAIEAVFPGTRAAILENKCPVCKAAIGPFRDALSRQEYVISGMCQECQDQVWGKGDDNDI
jgi:hypothetical protein